MADPLLKLRSSPSGTEKPLGSRSSSTLKRSAPFEYKEPIMASTPRQPSATSPEAEAWGKARDIRETLGKMGATDRVIDTVIGGNRTTTKPRSSPVADADSLLRTLLMVIAAIAALALAGWLLRPWLPLPAGLIAPTGGSGRVPSTGSTTGPGGSGVPGGGAPVGNLPGTGGAGLSTSAVDHRPSMPAPSSPPPVGAKPANADRVPDVKIAPASRIPPVPDLGQLRREQEALGEQARRGLRAGRWRRNADARRQLDVILVRLEEISRRLERWDDVALARDAQRKLQ
jgi:hypothetical protein